MKNKAVKSNEELFGHSHGSSFLDQLIKKGESYPNGCLDNLPKLADNLMPDRLNGVASVNQQQIQVQTAREAGK